MAVEQVFDDLITRSDRRGNQIGRKIIWHDLLGIIPRGRLIFDVNHYLFFAEIDIAEMFIRILFLIRGFGLCFGNAWCC